MPQPVAVVVVTWNSRDDIGRCLHAASAERPAELVVVDNGSTDDTTEIVRQRHPDATLIELDMNRGFSHGCNVGVAASTAPYVLFLNSDAVLAPGYLARLVAALAADPVAASAVGKLVFHRDGRRFIDSAGIVLRLHAMSPLDRGHGEPDVGQYDEPGHVFGPSAAAALYRREALKAAGAEVFDEDLFAYYEDVDLAWRLRRLGWRHLYVPAAVAEHPRRGPGEKPVAIAALAFANRLLVWLKNDSLLHLVGWGPFLLARELARLARAAWRRPELLPPIARSLGRVPRFVAKRRLPAARSSEPVTGTARR